MRLPHREVSQAHGIPPPTNVESLQFALLTLTLARVIHSNIHRTLTPTNVDVLAPRECQHTIPYYTTRYHTIPHNTIARHTIPYNIILYHTIPHNTMLYHTIPKNSTEFLLQPMRSLCTKQCEDSEMHSCKQCSTESLHQQITTISHYTLYNIQYTPYVIHNYTICLHFTVQQRILRPTDIFASLHCGLCNVHQTKAIIPGYTEIVRQSSNCII